MSKKKNKKQPVNKLQFLYALSPSQKKGLVSIIGGSLLMLIVASYRIQQAVRLSFAISPSQVQAISSKPRATILQLPKYKVTIDITESAIVDGVWQINETTVNHLNTSANPGEAGNIILYGHNSREIFGPLRWMSIGEEIELTTQDGEKKTYRIEQVLETSPSDIQWVLPKNEEVLTLYTCSGFLNSKRHILIAKPIGD